MPLAGQNPLDELIAASNARTTPCFLVGSGMLSGFLHEDLFFKTLATHQK